MTITHIIGQHAVILTTGISVLFLGPPMPSKIHAADQKGSMRSDEEKLIRDAVYSGKLAIGEADRSAHSIIDVPRPLTDIYADHRERVLALLVTIAEGGNPKDSVLATAYAFALLGRPESAVGCIRLFNSANYDVVEEHWEMTPREHWIKRIRLRIEQEGNASREGKKRDRFSRSEN